MSEFSKNLKRLRKTKKMSLEELANDLNKKYGDKGAKFNKSMLSKYENGKSADVTNSSFLAAYFGIDYNDLIGLEINEDQLKEETAVYKVDSEIPIIGTIAAGTPLFAEQNIVGYAPAPPMVNLKGRNVFYLEIKGDSMNREFANGSYVLIDRDLQVENGEIAAVLVNGDEATVKKVYKKDNLLTLMPMSTDSSYFPQVIDLEKEEVTVIGKVIGAFKQY